MTIAEVIILKEPQCNHTSIAKVVKVKELALRSREAHLQYRNMKRLQHKGASENIIGKELTKLQKLNKATQQCLKSL